jgi:glycogen operon protein
VQEAGVSGFRFDLATILGRSPGFDPNAKMLEMIKTDPVLSKCLLIAEPWDIGPGGYQLGQFGREFREWNDTYRDDVRAFWQGGDGKIGALAGKVAGSSEIFNFAGRKPSAGVNFLAVHDGFTLMPISSATSTSTTRPMARTIAMATMTIPRGIAASRGRPTMLASMPPASAISARCSPR